MHLQIFSHFGLNGKSLTGINYYILLNKCLLTLLTLLCKYYFSVDLNFNITEKFQSTLTTTAFQCIEHHGPHQCRPVLPVHQYSQVLAFCAPPFKIHVCSGHCLWSVHIWSTAYLYNVITAMDLLACLNRPAERGMLYLRLIAKIYKEVFYLIWSTKTTYLSLPLSLTNAPIFLLELLEVF